MMFLTFLKEKKIYKFVNSKINWLINKHLYIFKYIYIYKKKKTSNTQVQNSTVSKTTRG